MFSNIGSAEVVVVSIALLLLFGGKKLPEFARGLGEATKELKKAQKEFQNAVKDSKE